MGHSFFNIFRVLVFYHIYYISGVGGDVNESYFQAPPPTGTASLMSSTNGHLMPTHVTNPMTCDAPSAPQWTLSCEPNPVIACDATHVRARPWHTPEIQVSGPSSPKTTCNSPSPLPPLLQGKSTFIPPPSKGTLVPILHPIEGPPTLSSLSPTQTSQPLIEETSTPTQTFPTTLTLIPPTFPPTLPPIPPTDESTSTPASLPPILASFLPIHPPLPIDQHI